MAEIARPKNKIVERLSNLKLSVENKTEDPSDELSSLLEDIKTFEGKIRFTDDDFNTIGCLLQWDSNNVKAKTVEILALLAKKENFRERCLNTKVVPWLCNIIRNPPKDEYSFEILMHTCRALGNLCYENARHREYITENGGLNLLIKVIQFCNNLKIDKETSAELRNCTYGVLLNYLMGQEELYPMALESGMVDLLTDGLIMGTEGQHGGNAGVNILIMLGVFADLVASTNKPILNERLCNALVKCLKECTPGELSELCIELCHSQTEYPTVSLNLASAGMVEVLMDLLEEHENISRHNELRNIFKMACDLIILIMNDDKSMELLYENGKGHVFKRLTDWMSHSNDDIQVTGVLATGNFARTDDHCIELVNQKVDEKLLKLLKNNNTEAGDLKYQHALLSALRNLVIPAQNKTVLIKDGLLEALYPMLSVTSFPVVFKLLGTLRMLVDGQEKVADEMGRNKELIEKLVEWCLIRDHPGVQGEACRLIAWIIKNSRNRDIMGIIVECKAVPCLVDMITTPYTVMQIEALLSLSLLCAMRLTDAEQSLVDANIGGQLNNLLVNFHPEKEAFQNLLTLVSQLCSSAKIKTHLRHGAMQTALSTFVKSSGYTEFKDQVARLTILLGST